MSDYHIFEAGDVVLQSGLTYRDARLAYKTHGTLNTTKSNVIPSTRLRMARSTPTSNG